MRWASDARYLALGCAVAVSLPHLDVFFGEIAKHPVICIDAAFVESLLYKFSFDTWMVCFFPSAHKNHYN
jgi:hypothetical protein